MKKVFVSSHTARYLIFFCLTLLISAVIGSNLLLSPLPAKAATNITSCQGQTCEGLDPQNAGPQGVGCAPLDGIIVMQADIQAFLKDGHPPTTIGTLYLWYSPTCGTNWGQVINHYNCRGCTVNDLHITANTSTGPTEKGLWTNIFPPDPNDAKEDHTYMLYAPTAPVQACATITAGVDTDGTPIQGTNCLTQSGFQS